MRERNSDRTFWIARHLLPHEPALRRYLERQRLPAGLDADDIIQEVYGRFAEMESVETVRDARTFMLGVGRNVTLEALRRERVVSIRSTEDIGGFEVPADEPTPEDYASDRQQLHLLALAVSRIKEPWRMAFLFRVIDELPYREIGQRLGMSENAVQKSHAKTLAKLMQILGRGGSEGLRATGKQHNVTSEDRNEQG